MRGDVGEQRRAQITLTGGAGDSDNGLALVLGALGKLQSRPDHGAGGDAVRIVVMDDGGLAAMLKGTGKDATFKELVGDSGRGEALPKRYLTMDDVAKELGMSKKTIYHFVDNKAQLVQLTMQSYLEEERKELENILKPSKNSVDAASNAMKISLPGV